jgi:hypothetical protein
MSKTKWMRLGVRDPADILRWAADQNTRQLDEFRYRTIRGVEFVSFRMVPRYAIEIGTSDIVVVAHVLPGKRQLLAAASRALGMRFARHATAMLRAKPRSVLPPPAPMAELYRLEFPRASVRV